MIESTTTARLKILLSAYACEPGKGSEPGVGWRWAAGLAGRVELTVATRANNRGIIEKAIHGLEESHPLHRVRFLYHDLPRWLLSLKRARLLPTMAYYALWQWTIARRLRDEVRTMDIVHHLTFCTAMFPGFWKPHQAAFVIGPVAAPLVNSHYLPLFGPGRFAQTLRGFLMRHLHWMPWTRNAFHRAQAVVPANSETKALLEGIGVGCLPLLLDTGAPEHASIPTRPTKPPGPCRFLYAGVLERRKGLELALRAFAIAINNQQSAIDHRQSGPPSGAPGDSVLPEPCMLLPSSNQQPAIVNHQSFTLLGTGPDRKRLESLTRSLGIADQVHFAGSVQQSEVSRYFEEADVFVFCSVRDASGGVNLEAMAHGLPIICVAHQGVGDITDESCAERVPPGPVPETVDALANAIARLAADPERRVRMGAAAARRASAHFSWDEKFDRMLGIYQESVPNRTARPMPA